MSRSVPAKQFQLATPSFELAVAAPQVVAYRMARMMGAAPDANDRRDFRRMGAEKAEAAAEAWSDMASQAARSAQNAVSAYLQSWWSAWMKFCFPVAGGRRAQFPAWGMTPIQLQHATLDVIGKGLAPVHRRAVANATRLRRAKGR